MPIFDVSAWANQALFFLLTNLPAWAKIDTEQMFCKIQEEPYGEGQRSTLIFPQKDLWKEAEHVSGLGETIFQQGIEQGIKALILDNLEEGIPRERTLIKLQKRFDLDEEKANAYYEQFASKGIS